MATLLITHLPLNRIFAVLNKALIGIVSALVFLFIQAVISSINTKATYEFSTKKNDTTYETLQIILDDGHASMLINGKCQNENSAYSIRFNGLYLRFQNHYYLLGMEHIGNNNSQLMFNDFFIDSLRSGDAIYISRTPSFCQNSFSEVLLGKRIIK